jgi:hypothetical protein
VPYDQVHQFPYGQATPPGSPQLYTTAPSHAQVPQLSSLGAANQAQALAQQQGLSLAEQQQLLEAFLAQQTENSQKAHAPFANEKINPQQKVAADHELELRPSESLVNQFLNRDLDLVPYKTFKEDHPQTRLKIEALASEVPTPISITSKWGTTNPWGKTNRLSKLQQINDHRIHLLKLINSSKLSLGSESEITRYNAEVNRITTELRRYADDCNQRAASDDIILGFTRVDNRKLGSYASQLSQTAEQLRAILNNHSQKMPTKKDQATNFTEYLVELNRQVKNDFADAYPEAKTKDRQEALIRKLRQYNQEIRGFLKTELPNAVEGSEFDFDDELGLKNRIQPITSKEIDSLTEFKKADLRIGDAFKVGALGGALTLAAASFAKATGITGLTQPILRLGLGGTAAGMLFSTLPSKIKEPLIQGEPTKALENLFQRGQAKSWLMPAEPKENSPASKHIKYSLFSQF